jgi:sodium-coupled monocarboxylate transporter 8/12
LLFIQGGMKAVIWTDVLQTIVILVGLLATIIQGLITLDGFKRTFSIASQGGRIIYDK